MNQTTSQQSIRTLLLIVTLVLVLISVVGGVEAYRLLGTVGNEAVLGTEATIELNRYEGNVQIAFDRQMKGWQDMLLRGKDALSIRQYLQNFRDGHDQVQNNLTLLSVQMAALGFDTSQVVRLEKEHEALLELYERAVKQSPPERNRQNLQHIDLLTGDAAQDFAVDLDELRSSLNQTVLARSSTLNDKVRGNHHGEMIFVEIILLLLFPIVGLTGVIALSRVTQKIQAERERFGVTLNSIGDAVIVTDLSGRVEYLNPVGETLTGWRLQEAIGRPLQEVFNIFNEETRVAIENPVNKVLRKGQVIGLDERTILVSRHGEEFAIEDSAAPLRDSNDELSGVVLVFHDDTRQRQAQHQLKEREERLSMTLKYAPDAVFITEQNGRIIYTNDNVVNMLGYSSAELNDMTVFDLSPSDWREPYREALKNVLDCEDHHLFEIRLVRKDGSKIPMELNLVKLPNGRVYGSCRDISERKMMEKSLAESELRYRTLIEKSPLCVHEIDLQGNFLSMNRSGLDMLQLEDEGKVCGIPFISAVSKQDNGRIWSLFEQALLGFTCNFEFTTAGDRPLYFKSCFIPILDAQGGVMKLMGMTEDITQRKLTESLLFGQKRVLEMIAADTPFTETLNAIIRLVESLSPGMLGSILLMDELGKHVLHGAAPSLPEEYIAAVNGAPIGPKAGSCGTAAYRKAPVYVEDIEIDPLWEDYKALALPHGLRACWSTPILDLQQNVIGIFAMYYRHPALPDSEHLGLIEIATQTASIALSRHRTEQTLKKSEEAFRTLFEASRDALVILSSDEGFLKGNRAALELFGCQDHQMFTSCSLAKLSPEFQADGTRSEEQAHRMHQLVCEEGSQHFEWIFLRHDGGEFYADVLMSPIELEGKQLFYATIRDITLRKQADLLEQQKLDELESISLLSEAVGSATSIEQVYAESMDYMLRLLKADRVSIMLFDSEGLIHFRGWRDLSDNYRKQFDDHSPWAQETTDPLPIFVEDIEHDDRFTGIRDAIMAEGIRALCFIPLMQHGNLLGMFGVYFNSQHFFSESDFQLAQTISSHVAFAIDRKLAEQQFVDMFQFAPDAIVMTDRDAVITMVNRQAQNLFGYLPEELVGETIDILIPQDRPGSNRLEMRQRFLRSAMRPRSLGENGRKDLRAITKEGRIFSVEISLSPMESPTGRLIATAIRDVSGRQQVMEQLLSTAKELEHANAQIEEERALLAQRVLERTAQLMIANKSKDSFLATMSHEIRTPLGGLLGMMELLGLSKLNKEQHDMLHVAQNSGKSLLRIVDDILDWSKIEAGKLELAPAVNSIDDMLKSVTNTYSQLASTKGIVLQRSVDDNLAIGHIFDRLRISQILNNFTSNAIKFTEHGCVELSAELVNQLDGNETIRFSVRDTGVGIDVEHQGRLFKQYEQASNETARMYGGTGLGLAICQSLADLMEGTLSVQSTVGVGTTFHFIVRLPVANFEAQRELMRELDRQEKRVDRIEISPINLSGKPVQVLVVDDHPVNRIMLKQQLEQLGLAAQVAETGLAGISLWWTSHFDLVITDCHMPGMDGYEMTRSIREIEQQEQRQRVPVIAWTANALAEEHDRCRNAGMDDLLTKPTELIDLRTVLAKWIRHASITESRAIEQSAIQQTIQSAPALELYASGEAPLDLSVLTRFATSQALQIEMLKEFNHHNRSDVANLMAALKDGNPAAVSRAAHRIKGACRMVGAVELASISARIEQAAKQEDMEGARAAAERVLEAAIRRVEASIEEFVGY